MLELYVTGTGKNSGKTFITAGLAATMQSLGYDTCVYKPVQTGAVIRNGYLESPDLSFVKYMDPYIKTYFTYLLKNDAIPLIAADIENVDIDKDTIYQDYKSLRHECILTDGAQGLSTPLASDFLEQDFVKMVDIPVLTVVSLVENTVDNILAGINNAISSNVKLRGIVINNCPDIIDMSMKSLPKLVEKYTDTRVLGVMPYVGNIEILNPNDLISNILRGIDIESVFGVKIAKLSC